MDKIEMEDPLQSSVSCLYSCYENLSKNPKNSFSIFIKKIFS